jgi:sirohydrochlorin ferrochelatase
MMATTTPTAIILFAHGSRVEEANSGVCKLATQIEEAGGFSYVRAAFLEVAHPDLSTAINEAARAGRRRIIIIPYFLTMGVHLRRDLPKLAARERDRHPGLDILVGDSLEGHSQLVSIILDRIGDIEKRPT